ncbi:MAG: hypothetical protein ABFC98_04700 [Candidatus Cloacimonas sp.]
MKQVQLYYNVIIPEMPIILFIPDLLILGNLLKDNVRRSDYV